MSAGPVGTLQVTRDAALLAAWFAKAAGVTADLVGPLDSKDISVESFRKLLDDQAVVALAGPDCVFLLSWYANEPDRYLAIPLMTETTAPIRLEQLLVAVFEVPTPCRVLEVRPIAVCTQYRALLESKGFHCSRIEGRFAVYEVAAERYLAVHAAKGRADGESLQ